MTSERTGVEVTKIVDALNRSIDQLVGLTEFHIDGQVRVDAARTLVELTNTVKAVGLLKWPNEE
jgi:hypothetical protein